jgi:tRNA(Ile2) C34 agmatinyltransferase TiaS
MTVSQLATALSTIRPNCPECQTWMRLFGIESEDSGHELYSYECPKCQRIETAVRPLFH